ncbi:MAG: glycoside hydrolase family 31 protein [Ferruginibacter sp.]
MNKLLKTACCIAFLSATICASAQQPANKPVTKISTASEVETTAGKWLFSLYPHNIIKATFTPVGSERNEQVSDAVIAKPIQRAATIERGKDKVTVFLPNNATIQVNRSGVDFNAGRGITISLVNIFYSNEGRGFKFSLGSDEKIFGTGERSIPLNRRGYKLNLNNAPAYGYSLNAEALNFSVPFILSSNKYAIFFDNPSKGYLDIGKSDHQILEYSVTSGELSFYIIPGDNYESIMESYHSLVGTAPLPPRWAMGNLMSRFGYRDEKQTRDIIAQMKKDSIPFDAVIFDLFWFGDSIKNTLGNLEWVNKTAWPNPKKMMSDFKNENIKTILITEPFVLKTSLNYEQSKHLLAVDSADNPYTLQEFYFGKGGIIDIFRKDAQQWFYKKYKTQMDIGVTGWWGDLGEPENHPADVYHNLKDFGFKRKFASGEVHNIYGHYWSKMLAENFKRDYPNQRLFHLNRSGYAGSPRYSSFPWSGDVSRSWDGLKGQLPLIQGMSMSGIPYMHSDAGGFAGGDGDWELYVRWLQFAAFTPIYRPHGTALGTLEPNAKDIPSEAALWPEPTKTRARNAAIIRYQWLPYNYNLTYLQTKSGKPLMTPMFFLNSSDSNLYKASDQYMWGDEVMVVPITEKGQKVKTFYVPYGKWTNLNNFKSYVGPNWYTDSAVSIESIPVFAKEGSFIPFMPGMLSTADYNKEILSVVYTPSAGASKYELYEDDGNDANAIRNKQYEITTFSCNGMKQSTTITINSNMGHYKGRVENRKMIIAILNMKQPATEIKVNGKLIPLSGLWDETKKIIKIPVIFQHKKLQVVINF